MRAAKKSTVGFHAMSDDAAAAMRTRWRQHLDRAFEAVESVRLAVYDDLERFVVVVPALLACCHLPSIQPAYCRFALRGLDRAQHRGFRGATQIIGDA